MADVLTEENRVLEQKVKALETQVETLISKWAPLQKVLRNITGITVKDRDEIKSYDRGGKEINS